MHNQGRKSTYSLNTDLALRRVYLYHSVTGLPNNCESENNLVISDVDVTKSEYNLLHCTFNK